MAELSKVVATDCFLPLINARVQVRARTCETVASDLGLWGGGGGGGGGGGHLELRLPPPLTDQPKYCRKGDDNRN